MNLKKVLLIALLVASANGFSQKIWTQIDTKDGPHYITNNMEFIDIPLLGIYTFQGKEPIVELKQYGDGFYQLHEQPKRAVTWGLECDEKGALLYKKGFDNSKYTLWYQYKTPIPDDSDDDMAWKTVEFTVHPNTLKMFIQGERAKDYKPIPSK